MENENASSPQASARRARGSWGVYFSLVLTIAFGVAVSLTIFFIFRNGEKIRLQSDFQSMAADRAQAIRAGLGEETIELKLLGSYVAAATELAEGREGSFAQEFSRFARLIPGLEPDSQVLFFIPRVPAARRAEVEKTWGSELGFPFTIREQSAAGELVAVGPRAEYFPVSVVEPGDFADSLLGFDLGSVPALQKAIADALSSAREAFSTRTGLPPTPSEPQYVWHFLAVTRTVAIPGTPAPRGELVGLVGSAFRIDQLVELSLTQLEPGRHRP